MVSAVALAFLALAGLGVFLLLQAIKLIRASLFGDIIAEAPLTQKRFSVPVPADGLYAIWLGGRRSQLAAVYGFQPMLWETTTQVAVWLEPVAARVYVGDEQGKRLQLFMFFAPVGAYTLAVGEHPSISSVSGILSRFFANKVQDCTQFSVQVRKAKPLYHGALGILLCILSVFMILGGIINASLAGQLVEHWRL